MLASAPLTFAIVSGSHAAAGHLAKMCAELERGLGCSVIPSVLSSYAALRREVQEGRAHLAWAPPVVAIDLHDAGFVTIDLCCTRGGRVDYHSVLFTQHTSRIEKLEDLRGCHVAWVDELSSAGHLAARLHLSTAGLDPDGLFGRESFLGTHAKVAQAVLDGDADAGATYASLDPATGRAVSTGWLEVGAAINAAWILATAGPIPCDAIALSNHLPSDAKGAIANSLTALPASVPDAVGMLLHADGFAPPHASHFDAMRALAATRRR